MKHDSTRPHGPNGKWAVFALLVIGLTPLGAQDGGSAPLKKLFSRKKAEPVSSVGPAQTARVAQVSVEAPPPPALEVAPKPGGADPYPGVLNPEPRLSNREAVVEQLIDGIYSEYEDKVSRFEAKAELQSVGSLPEVQGDFSSSWNTGVRTAFWSDSEQIRQDLVQVYARALEHSNSIKVFSDLPLIRETAVREAAGDYDWRPFAQTMFTHKDEPTTSTLTTGATGQDARLIENLLQSESGIRKKLASGGEVTLSTRTNSLESNSIYLNPNPQTGSEFVFGFVQPLGKGSGYAYNRARIKVAKLDANLASAEFIRALEGHLIEVNRAYWEVYLARAAFLQKRALLAETKEMVSKLEGRTGVDEEATRSELLRAKSSVSQIEATLIRGETAIRISEDRLRALINDPDFEIGAGGEFVPLTRPILSKPGSNVRETALAALYNRPEVVQAFCQLREAGIRRDVQRNEMKPQVNLLTEVKVAGLTDGRDVTDAWHDSIVHGTGVAVGLSYQGSLQRNAEIARLERQEYEFRQQTNQLRGTIDQVLLESVVAFRELTTAYRDMQGRYQAVLSSREEVRQLKERLDADAGGKGQSVGYQLQLILDSLERNQAAEERFLVSMVAYNSAFASVEKAKGTLLSYYDVNVRRFRSQVWERERLTLRKFQLTTDTLHAEIGGKPDVNPAAMDSDPKAWKRHRQALEELKNDRGM